MSKNKKKIYHLIFTNNSNDTFYKYLISSTQIKFFIFFSIIFSFLFLSIFIDYLGFAFEAYTTKDLKRENVKLHQKIKDLELKFSDYEKQMEKIETLSLKIKKIMDLESSNYLAQLDQKNNPIKSLKKESMRSIASMIKEGDPLEGVLKIDELDSYPGRLKVRIEKNIKKAKLQEQNISQLWSELSYKKDLIQSIPSIKPALGWISSDFGYRVDPFHHQMAMHYGIDIASPEGSPIYAPASGRVSYVGYDLGYGKILVIDHGHGIKTRYAHNSEILVSRGDKVKRWDVIATVGSTGRSSGSHLHYEVIVNGVPVKPRPYMLNL